jgi:exodeoxyribonuclease VII small subunit
MAGMSEKKSAKGGMPDDIAQLSYEQARDQLVEVVSTLEQGQVTLEESIALWERGEALATRCEEWLTNARERLDKARSATNE